MARNSWLRCAAGLVLLCGLTTGWLIATPAANPPPQTDKAAQDERKNTGEREIALAVANLKRNLDGIPQFVCRYTITDCKAPTLEDALLDRNVERGQPSWHVVWIVKKPVERFLAVTEKELLDQPVGRLIAPPAIRVGPVVGQMQQVHLKVFKNSLWDGSLLLDVSGGLPVTALQRGVLAGLRPHPRSPGTPLEGEIFNYTEPDSLLKNQNASRVAFAGVSPNGFWNFDRFDLADQQPKVKTALDPKHGFLPVHVARWAKFANGQGYQDWYATHFQAIGTDNWFTTRSFHDFTQTIVLKVGQKRRVVFREFKAEHFDAEKKVAEEDLAITIPRGHQIQLEGDNWALIVDKQDRLVSYTQLPQLLKELQASGEDWKRKVQKK